MTEGSMPNIPADPAENGNPIQIEAAELAAARAADGLRRALAAEPETHEHLIDVLQRLSAHQDRAHTWLALRRTLHALLTALTPFQANLRALTAPTADPADARSLLRIWRPCQTEVDRLVDLAQAAGTHAPSPHQNWVARIAALRGEMESRLREEAWSIPGLLDLAAEFGQTCHGTLDLIDDQLLEASEQTRRLVTHLLGGLS